MGPVGTCWGWKQEFKGLYGVFKVTSTVYTGYIGGI